MPLEVNVSLVLPRDAMTVPVVRHLCDQAMGELGVRTACRSDVLLALTEACTNVIDHSSDEHPYEVIIKLDEERCAIEVTDPASDFDESDIPSQPAEPHAEQGRGISLMQALVDKVSFVSEPNDGMVVHLTKDLEFEEDHPVREHLLGSPNSP